MTAPDRPPRSAGGLSIVYTSRDDPWLFASLEGLRRVDHAGLAVEVVVVLHRSPAAYTERITALAASLPLDVTVGYLERAATIAAARNGGARLAREDTLLFLDSDCVLYPDALGAVRDHQGLVANGAVEFVPSGSWLSRHNCTVRDIGYRALRERQPYMPNLLIDRSLFERLGGFRVGLARGEDFEFGDRLLACGARPAFLPGLRVSHLDDRHAWKTVKNWYRNGWGAGARRLLDPHRAAREAPPVLVTPRRSARRGAGYLAVSLLGTAVLALGHTVCVLSCAGRPRAGWLATDAGAPMRWVRRLSAVGSPGAAG